MRLILALLLAAMLGGCATTGTGGPMAENDPYEGFNRGMWEFNQAIDTVAIKPATAVYRTVTPVPARRGIRGMLANLSEPFRSEDRRVGKECVSTCRSRWSADH